ncbi:MAG TPA: ABC transporter substrate-binding protein [Polyangiaceae bacterium]|nr:ABC transporter substrate-binding protein [Polyangiaceae bacterium]
MKRRLPYGPLAFAALFLVLLVLPLAIACKSKKEPDPAAAAAPVAVSAAAIPAKPVAGPLRVAYSDWPGWTAFEIAIQKGWFKEEGVEVQFEWFEYTPSMEAFAAGKVDAVMMTMGDALVTGAPGARSVAILITDYSNGNDMIVAKPGIKDLKGLKGKKVGLEVGLVSHLLLLKGLEKAGMKESDVEIVKVLTHQTAQSLASGDVDAIGAWQPNSGQALKSVAGSRALWTSADVPGLIYDLVNVSPKSLAQRRADWVKFIKVWNRVARFIGDPANKDEAVKIMAGRAGVPPEEYAKFLPGTRFLSPEEALARFEKKDGLDSLYGSGKVADDFNVANKIYEKPQPLADYIDGSLAKEALGK